MEANTSNNYSNIIAPSDGVRRFLCKTSVLFLGIMAAVYCAFAFRMNGFEHDYSGGSLRTTMLYIAYIMFPLGALTAAIFARIKKMGLAFSMISLLVSTAGLFMLFLNSLSALFREGRVQGIAGSLFEMLMYAAAMAVFVNLVMSCMNCRIINIFGNIGAVLAALAMIMTIVRIITSYSAMQFAWNSEFDWNNLASQISGDSLQYQANWIFRCVSWNSPEEARLMFMHRFYERISACAFYAFFIVFFIKYNSEMSNFNKLIAHAKEYVDIPHAHIAESIASTERIISEKLKASTSSVKERLKNLKKIEDEDEAFGPLLSTDSPPEIGNADYAGEESYRRPDDEFSENSAIQRPRRRPDDEFSENSAIQRPRRRPDDEFGEDRSGQRPRRRPDDEFSENRPGQRPRRRPDDEFGENRPGQRPRRRPDDEFSEDRPGQRPRRRPDDEFSEDRPIQRPRRRPDDEFGENRAIQRPRRRPDDEFGEDRSGQRPRRREDDMTEEERYLMEERRKRNPSYNDDEERRMRQAGRNVRENIDRDYRRERQERRRRVEGGTQQNLNDYYNNYMKIRRERENNKDQNDT